MIVQLIKKRFLKNEREGSALLVALLVMGVLMAISLALSSLIFRELRITRDLLDSGRAYYAAESGIEVALYKVRNNLPGWEPNPDQGEYKFLEVSDDYASLGEYRVRNRCNAYPCFDEDEFDHGSVADLTAYYDVLDLNESINIPLFVADGNGGTIPVSNFTVEFFAPFDPDRHLDIAIKNQGNFELTGWDILRWKVFGINTSAPPDEQVTRSISDFTAIATARNQVDTVFTEEGEVVDEGAFLEAIGNIADEPSWFGSISCSEVPGANRYTDRITCNKYGTRQKVVTGETYQLDEDDRAGSYLAICDNTEAREHYNYGAGNNIDKEDIFECYPISTFLQQHEYNYLSLTNLMNPAIFPDSFNQRQKQALSKLYFRVELFGDVSNPNENNQTVREFADITANGYSGDAKQSINVQLRRGGFMPVFNFSLYSTYQTEEHEAEGYYYEDEDPFALE